MTNVNRDRLAALVKRERDSYAANFPRSRAAFAGAGQHLLGGVPMTWMRMWPGGFPVYQATARGARLTTVDGRELIDFCLGDTGAMAGHSPALQHGPDVPGHYHRGRGRAHRGLRRRRIGAARRVSRL